MEQDLPVVLQADQFDPETGEILACKNQILVRSVYGGCDDEFAYSMSGIIADFFLPRFRQRLERNRKPFGEALLQS
ncbi:hypothetical protein OPS91_19970 [Escherichia coli]|uniref:hypothetical protein n=1 Tax=Escherichia coli TaxID=562 RepID=UPI0022B5F70D|nr:hypothetical protein [Escherichia coli]MCZ7335090.1 hypothetical protein [Escherichia coli]